MHRTGVHIFSVNEVEGVGRRTVKWERGLIRRKLHPVLRPRTGMQLSLEPCLGTASHSEPIFRVALSGTAPSGKLHPSLNQHSGMYFPLGAPTGKRIPEFNQIAGRTFRSRTAAHIKTGADRSPHPYMSCPKAYLRIKPPRSSMASQKALAKRGSLAAMRALVAIQPEGVPVS